MKNLLRIVLICISLQNSQTFAQIILDTTLEKRSVGMGYDFKTVQISSAETKYYFADTITNTFSLYNIDLTPFLLNISVPEPFDYQHSGFQVLYLTRGLFDCDTSNIEYAYYAPGNIYKPFRIVRIDGTILFQKDSANAPYGYGNMLGGSDMIRPIINTQSGARLFLQQDNGQISIYSLCGSLAANVFDFTNINSSYVRLFPNPTAQMLTFEINIPDNINEYELVLFDNNAREISRKKVNSQGNNYTIDLMNFKNGAYYYSLLSKNKSLQAGKFIISK